MAPRKRKQPIKENDDHKEVEFPKRTSHPVFTVVQNAQINESFHMKYIKELQHIYLKIGHDEFKIYLIRSLQQFMLKPTDNVYATTALKFLAKFICSFQCEDTHSLLIDSFDWLLNMISLNPAIRFRLCQFVNFLLNSLGADAALDDGICDNILKYMLERLKDTSPMVRVQAVHALQRLQTPDNPNDSIVKIYLFHLNNDPSASVRQAVISCIGRNFHTIPSIMDRLWDVDDKVRRHTYLQMSSYPVKVYKVVQRLTFLEQGLNDQSEIVTKVVKNVLLPQWFESYNKDFVAFMLGLKLDSNIKDADRFRKAAKMAITELFKYRKDEELIAALQLEEDGEFVNCIPVDKLTLETSLLWCSLVEYFQENDEKCEQADLILPELTTFCNFIIKYCQGIEKGSIEKWKRINYQYVLLNLSEILLKFDLGDEIGRQCLKNLFMSLMTKEDIEEKTVENIVRCVENLIPLTSDRMQYFVDIIRNCCNLNSTSNIIDLSDEQITKVLDKDQNLKVRVTSLKLKIMELKEQESESIHRKEYEKTRKITEELNVCNEEITNTIRSALINSGTSESFSDVLSALDRKKVTNEMITRCLQMAFFAACSKLVSSLTPNMAQLFKDFIRPQIESHQMLIRDWALKCGATFSMLYPQLAKDTYKELNGQFYKHQNPKIWATSITAMFQLIDCYGFEFFDESDGEIEKIKPKKAARQLYNIMEYTDQDEDTGDGRVTGVDLMHLFDHFLDTCEDISITSALVDGFCRLILRGHYQSKDMVSKLLLKFFNPMTDPLINQMLGIFFETLVKTKRQECLQPALLPTLFVILEAPNESPLQEVKPETIFKFVIKSTGPVCSSPGLNIHNTIAMSFLDVMSDNVSNKELLRLFSSVFRLLEISDDISLRNDLKSGLERLEELPLDAKTLENIKHFKTTLDGNLTTFLTSGQLPSRPSNGSLNEPHSDNEHEQHSDIEEDDASEHNNDTEKNEQENPEEHEIIETETAVEPAVENKSTNHIENHNDIEDDKNSNEDVSNTDENSITEDEEVERVLNTKTTPPMPTMYGLDNSTDARFLRKSLHLRQLRNTVPPSKVLIVDKNASKQTKQGIQAQSKNRKEEDNKKTEKRNAKKENEKHTNNDKPNRSMDTRKVDSSTKQKEKPNQNSQEISLSETLTISSDDDEETNNEVIDLTKNMSLDEIPASPDTRAIENRSSLRSTRKTKIPFLTRQKIVPSLTSSGRTTRNSNQKTNNRNEKDTATKSANKSSKNVETNKSLNQNNLHETSEVLESTLGRKSARLEKSLREQRNDNEDEVLNKSNTQSQTNIKTPKQATKKPKPQSSTKGTPIDSTRKSSRTTGRKSGRSSSKESTESELKGSPAKKIRSIRKATSKDNIDKSTEKTKLNAASNTNTKPKSTTSSMETGTKKSENDKKTKEILKIKNGMIQKYKQSKNQLKTVEKALKSNSTSKYSTRKAMESMIQNEVVTRRRRQSAGILLSSTRNLNKKKVSSSSKQVTASSSTLANSKDKSKSTTTASTSKSVSKTPSTRTAEQVTATSTPATPQISTRASRKLPTSTIPLSTGKSNKTTLKTPSTEPRSKKSLTDKFDAVKTTTKSASKDLISTRTSLRNKKIGPATRSANKTKK